MDRNGKKRDSSLPSADFSLAHRYIGKTIVNPESDPDGAYHPRLRTIMDQTLQSRISLSTETGKPLLTETRIRLLEAIGATGALSRAAREVPMSYKGAWDTLETMNRLAGTPLVRRVIGGRRGGGTELTEDGMLLIALYRAVEKECQEALRILQHYIEHGGATTGFRYLLHRHTLADRAEAVEPVRY